MQNDNSEDEIGAENKLMLSIFTYKYDVDGLKFKEEYGYHLINEGF
jgi:hypothetical protein